ncbi:ABC transporter ATP-binding protein [Actinocatenispora thailandica]|uniref:ABC transporter ATP-binding protein n=1 Tax=Actinocatenispora thailandica TaxID=227318 RepID=A0A7R7HV80_9ACTN|nr:ABC-F family ATP-binding cassette domain-containing protein [Actinocatenispora thailandica]BCJ32948.1 ABC transporter ATP-binding protein [Actinocatenispora thailandica]
MANIVNLDRVAKQYASGVLFDDVSLGLDDSDRVGVVGLNGAGKSTLLRLITGAEEPDSGRLTRRRGLAVGSLPQQVDLPPTATVRDVVVGDAWLPALGADTETGPAEHLWAGDAAVRAVLRGLGMPGLGLDTATGPLSGGEKRRVALAALLIRPADLLILDEPTNHLDIAGVSWLAAWLTREHRGALAVVTHDRWFLDAVCTTTWEVADGTVRSYEGGYAAWTLARAERVRREAVTEQRRQNLLRKELAWLQRGAPARTSKPKFRIDAANALIADVPQPRDSVSLHRLATARLGKQVYDLENVTVAHPAPAAAGAKPADDDAGPGPADGAGSGGKTILHDATFRVGPGDRIALVGANGAGKTTLLRLLTDQLTPDTGTVRIGQTVRAGYLSQQLSELPTGARVLEAIEQVARRVRFGDRELTAAQLAELFGFGESRLWSVVADLSGGERRRLQLLRLLAGEPNVLLLDEPTNDLDTDTLAELEDLLDSWPGTLIVASHDRYLVERVCDTVFALLGDGAVTHLPGGIDQYLTLLPEPGGDGTTPITTAPAGPKPERTGPSAAEVRAGKKELARLERLVARLETKESTLHAQLAEHATDYAKVTELDAELAAIRAERTAAEEEWLTLATTLG